METQRIYWLYYNGQFLTAVKEHKDAGNLEIIWKARLQAFILGDGHVYEALTVNYQFVTVRREQMRRRA